MVKRILLPLLLFFSCFLSAQNLYWIGGAGYWNDVNHWSYTSGGVPAGIAPNASTHVIFDNNSSSTDAIVHILQNTQANTIQASLTNGAKVRLVSSSNVNLTVYEGVDVNEFFFFQLNGKLLLSPQHAVKYNFSHNNFSNDVVLNANNTVELGSFNSTGNFTLMGHFTLKNSIILGNTLHVDNANLYLDNVTMLAKNGWTSQSVVLATSPGSKNRLILDKSQLSQQQNNYFAGVGGLQFAALAPASCTASVTASTAPTCFQLCNGTATISLSGCTNPPYDLQWLNAEVATPLCQNLPPVEIGYASTTYTVNGMCPCSTPYQLLVTNALGEQTAVSVLMPNPPATLLSFSSTQPTCNGLCNGQIRVNVVSALTPIVLTYSPSATTHSSIVTKDTLKLACAGVYTITATNANGCVNTFTTNLAQPAVLLPNGAQTNIICGGTCTGAATVSPSGGTAAYSTVWSNATVGPTTGSLCAGVITATVTDSKNCKATYSTTITQPPPITLTVTKSNLSCSSSCNGTATITATGGVAPFTYNWSPSVSSSSVATSLCVGSYTVNVTDNLGCTKTVTLSITSPPPLTTTPTGTNVLCHGLCTGAINSVPGGGTPPYSYAWTPSVSSGSVATNLCAGVYTYTITDALACTIAQSYTITEPPLISLAISHTDVTCNGLCNGTASVTASGGVSPFTYTWSPGNPTGQGTSQITNLCPATYTVNTKDANGCANTGTVTITQPSTITPNVSSVIPTCNGQCNGSISAAPSGGTPGYTYTLQPTAGAPVTGTPPFTGLCAGNYTLTIKDANGCVLTRTMSLNQPNPITLALSATPISCANQCNSTISSVVAGGTPAYTYTWSTGSNATTLVNQCTGVYSATVTDIGGCTATASVNVTSPTAMTVAITPTNVNCNGQCNGAATASVTGGTPNYTYSWTPTGTTAPTASALCAGNYTVTVTDFKGCITTQTTSIIAPPAITLTPAGGTVTCAGACNGTVGVTASGGTPNYSYSWNSVPAQTTSVTAANLCPGNYAVTVTDAHGCISSIGATITQPTVLTATISNIQPSCNVCIGAATANPSGGTPPYTYNWVNSTGTSVSTNQTATNLCVGNYTVTITDSHGCTTTKVVNIPQIVSIVVTTNGTVLQCNGGCSGVATANVSGGVSPYAYTWNTTVPTQTTQSATNLCAGVYTVTVTDNLGCSNTGTVSFTNPPAITLTVNKTDVKCNGVCNGSITASASGGTGPLTYQWLPTGQTTPTVTGLCAGTYTLNVSDGNGCTKTQTVAITEPSTLTATFNSVNPTTCISSDGSISVTPAGGTAPYTFTWSPGGSTSNPLTNLPDGTYSVTIKDANLCTQTIITTLSDPAGPTLTVTTTSVACFGQCTGASTVSASGSSPFTYSWTAGAAPSNSVNTGFCAGNYAVQVTDVNSCVTSQTINVAQPLKVTLNGVITNATCNGACTGSVNLTPAGGTGTYNYTWTPSGGNVQDPTALCANNYTVNVTDGNGCPATATFAVTQPSSLTLTYHKKDVLCNGNCNGAVRAIASGGSSPYTYNWAPLAPFAGSTLDTIVNLCPGVYTVTATDALGCSITGTVSIGQPPLLTSTITAHSVKCNGQCTGSSTLTASGGTLPYTYLYNSPPPNTTAVVNNLCAGNYQGTVTDANGCTSTNTFVIIQPPLLTVTTAPTNPKCNAVCNGSIAATVNGGSPNYTYQWIPAGGTVQNPTGLCAGMYTVTVTDDSLCTAQSIVTLTDPPALLANASFTNPTCSGGCDGKATSNPVGGTLPYTYSWQAPPQSSQTITNLCAGGYTVMVSDANGCSDTQTITLVSPTGITLNPAVSPAACGVNNGSITVTPVTGNTPFTYNWLPPIVSTSSVVTNLGAGVYTVVVTDAASCTATISIPLSNSNGPTGATLTSTNVICNSQCNGQASISNPVGGTPSYTLAWVNPVSTNTLITNLCPGSYTAQITDANNCLLFMPVTITEPQVIDDNELLSSSTCFGNCNGSIALSPTGGNGGYVYSWSDGTTGSSISNLCPGSYSVTITDALNCTFTANYNLPSLITITSNTFATNNACFGNCSGSLLATNVAGGLPPYTYQWTDPLGQTTVQANNLCNGTYSVTITDANGCFNTTPGDITSPSQIAPNPSVTNPSCGLCNGSATLTPSGGNGGAYTVVWSNTQTGNTVSGLCAGVYAVQLTDNIGCVTDTDVVINSSSTVTASITKADESCAATCDGSVTVTASGGTAPYTYHWVHNNSAASSLTGMCAGTYFCNIADSVGCSFTASVTIGAASDLTVTPLVTQTSCNSSTGSIAVTVSGGTGPYTYSWLPAGNTATLSGLPAGTYTLTVSDANACSKTQVFAMNSINGPLPALTTTNVNCSAACNGSATVTITGGTSPYTIQWSTGASTPTVGSLCAGTYSLLVTDNTGCSGAQTFSISNSNPIVFSTPDVNNPLCHNDCNGSINAIPIGGTLPFTYAWNPGPGSTPALANLCANNYSVSVTDALGCTATQTFVLNNPPSLGLVAAVSNPSCSATPNGTIDITVSGGTPSYTYTWSGATSSNNQDLNNIFVGTYSLHVSDASGCSKDTSIVLTSTLIVNAVAGNDTSFCQGGPFTLNGNASVGGTTYQWLELPANTVVANTTTVVVNPATGTSTFVLVANGGTCTDSDTIMVTSNVPPVVDAGPFVSIPIMTSTQIGGNPTCPTAVSYTWTPAFGLDNGSIANPTASNTITTQYTVTVTDANGCTGMDTITVDIFPQIKIPNGFSPNSDGKNDTWIIDNIQQFPDCTVEVYNRWGERLFYSTGYGVPWDGRFKGKDLPVGTYYYVINLNHPSYPDAYTGPLTIFR
ncbi:MAG: gliding motility-associated C-terminal domain-containing protein [Bacteroidetes bacterium]|nr:gliding motility-associated C-terminal domain-containing protein [Bacteroidota bacterium]